MSILKIQNLRYKNILNDISITLNENSFNVLLGPNGSGKTTLVKCIAGLISYSGEIFINGELMCKNNIGYLIKNIGILSSFSEPFEGTVLYNITYPLLNLNYSEIEAKKIAYEISEKLDINDILLKDVSTLSSSKKKIVSFASSIVHKPNLIIIDDSFSELEDHYKKIIVNYLKKLKNTTILIVTNDSDFLLLSDYLGIIKDGKLMCFDSTTKILEDEKNFTKNNVKLPFIVDLSHKAKFYQLIDTMIFDDVEMVNSIWK